MIDDDREWLEGGDERSGGAAGLARPEIVNSWRRSRLSGVNPDTVTMVPGEVSLDSRIAKVAIPVLGSMADILIGAKTSLLMAPTLLKLVREVEEQLYGDSTLRERELLRHFLAERRHGRNAVVAVSEDVVIADKAGARL